MHFEHSITAVEIDGDCVYLNNHTSVLFILVTIYFHENVSQIDRIYVSYIKRTNSSTFSAGVVRTFLSKMVL